MRRRGCPALEFSIYDIKTPSAHLQLILSWNCLWRQDTDCKFTLSDQLGSCLQSPRFQPPHKSFIKYISLKMETMTSSRLESSFNGQGISG